MDPKRDQQGKLASRRGAPKELDLWFEKATKPHCGGDAMICRYADDWVCAFRYRVLPKRLEKFHLEVPPKRPKSCVSVASIRA